MTKSGSNCCKLPLNATEKNKKEKQEVIASLVYVKEISVDVPVATVSSELNIFTLKVEERGAWRLFLWTTFFFFFALLSASFGKSLDEH